jgi:hypothetical protein
LLQKYVLFLFHLILLNVYKRNFEHEKASIKLNNRKMKKTSFFAKSHHINLLKLLIKCDICDNIAWSIPFVFSKIAVIENCNILSLLIQMNEYLVISYIIYLCHNIHLICRYRMVLFLRSSSSPVLCECLLLVITQFQSKWK